MMIVHYATKKDLAASIGERLKYSETSMFGEEWIPDGVIYVARRPHLQGGGREFFAEVTMSGGLIKSVK
tara:strand:- start:473 stop:679 length:207 start_codon:yes stop_codon:yes gene_type:complete